MSQGRIPQRPIIPNLTATQGLPSRYLQGIGTRLSKKMWTWLPHHRVSVLVSLSGICAGRMSTGKCLSGHQPLISRNCLFSKLTEILDIWWDAIMQRKQELNYFFELEELKISRPFCWKQWNCFNFSSRKQKIGLHYDKYTTGVFFRIKIQKAVKINVNAN